MSSGAQTRGTREASELMRLLEIEIDEAGPSRAGRLAVEANAIHQGRSQQLWQVEIIRIAEQKLVARGQVRLQIIDAKDA